MKPKRKPQGIRGMNSQLLNEKSLEQNIKTLAFVEFDKKKLTGTFLRLPERNEFLTEIKENLIVEFYNR